MIAFLLLAIDVLTSCLSWASDAGCNIQVYIDLWSHAIDESSRPGQYPGFKWRMETKPKYQQRKISSPWDLGNLARQIGLVWLCSFIIHI